MNTIRKIEHLVVVTPSFPKNEENDIVVPPLNLYLRELKVKSPDLKISVIALHFPFHTTPYQIWNIDVYPCGGKNGSLVFRPAIWRKAKKYLGLVHKKKPIDIIQSFWLNESPLIVKKMSLKLNIPHVCTLMGQDAKPSNRYIKFFKNYSPTLITLSDFQKNVLEKNTNLKVSHVIPWGVVSNEFESISKNERSIDLLCVSSLIPLKRVGMFIDLVEKIKASGHDNIQAVIIGGGELQGELAKKIDSLKLNKNIKILGLKPRQETLLLMRRSKVLVHTSSYEAQGYVLNEALASGCYVLALSHGLIVKESKFELHVADELIIAITRILRQKKMDFTAKTPISMTDTIKMYNKVLAQKGLFFSI